MVPLTERLAAPLTGPAPWRRAALGPTALRSRPVAARVEAAEPAER